MFRIFRKNGDEVNNSRIIQVEIAGKGGICHYTYNLAKSLVKSRKVLLITGENYELKGKELNFEVLEMFNRLKTNPFFIFKFLGIVRGKDTAICHFQLSQYPIFILFLIRLVKMFSGTEVVVTAHNISSHEKKIWEREGYANIYRLADKIIVHAEANKQEILTNFSLEENKISVIPHGNYMFFDEDEQIDTDKAYTDEKTILFFGYIREYKGLIYLIRAFKKIAVKIPESKLLIVGKPVDSFKKYDDEIKKLHLSNNVETRLDYVPFKEVKDYFSKATIMVLPYEKIYQSGVVQLAYGFGIPVVVTNTGGLPEVVEDGGNGYIVPVGDVDKLADSIMKILKDDSLQVRMGLRSLELAKTRFNWETIAEKTISVYQELEKI